MRAENDKHLVLSRRNLVSLLAKLDGHPPESFCRIQGGDEALGWTISAEPDEIHYADRMAGAMHPATEEAIA